MEYTHFLNGCLNEPRRARLWDVFQGGRHWIDEFTGPFTEIVEVAQDPTRNTWHGGHILLVVDDEDGCILHELFHSKYDPSAIHDGATDEQWGDAFCDAFRYFASRKLGITDRWVEKIAGFAKCNFDEIMAQSTDPQHDKRYGYPASRIIASVGEDWQSFPDYWDHVIARRLADGHPILNEMFSFEI